MDALLSIDIGTESARAALLDLSGRVLASSTREYDLSCPKPGWAEQKPDSWWNATVANIRDVLTKSLETEILAIGIGGQMHATVAVDKEGRLVSDSALLWCDKRSAPQCQAVQAEADEAGAQKTTGNIILPCWIGPKLRWIKENWPDVYRRAAKFLTCKDYLNLRLTGALYTDYSEASGTYLFNAHTRGWSLDLCRLLGVDPEKLPPIAESSQVIGKVTPEAAAVTGLSSGTPVVCGGGDMMCILLGAGLIGPGRAVDITGTAADISVFTNEPLYDQRLMHLHHVVPGGGWISFGILDAGGGSYKWFRDTLAAAESAEAKRLGVPTYEVLDRQAEQAPPGAEGLFYLPYLLGERTLGTPDSRGVFFGLTPRHRLGHLVRAIMEGVTYDLRQSLEIIKAKGVMIDEIRAIAGGARSPLWCQIKADIYQAPLLTLDNFEGGVVGGAILAGLGVGAYRDVADAVERVIRIDRKHIPDPTRVAQYDRFYRVFQSMHDGFQPYFKQVAELSLDRR